MWKISTVKIIKHWEEIEAVRERERDRDRKRGMEEGRLEKGKKRRKTALAHGLEDSILLKCF
jgi:hypothetical protein